MYLAILILYILLLFFVGWITSRRHHDNAAFFSANRTAPWYVVAFGMIGASVSGISVVSVPGMVTSAGWTYLQTCIGFFFGYVVVAYVLLPLYYKLNLTSIYQYLDTRYGRESRLTGAWLFVVAKIVSSASKLYVAVIVLQQFVFAQLGVPLWVTVVGCVAVMWLYTQRSGIRTIVWTDALQTALLIVAIVVMCVEIFSLIGMPIHDLSATLAGRDDTRIFEFDDMASTRNFWKQFVSGIFIVVVMTGLDQDMMQKNLTCRTLGQSQRNMLSYGAAFVPVNFLLLFLGSMCVLYASQHQLVLPSKPDAMLPMMVSSAMSPIAGIAFMVGIVSATFSSADSALTSITTSIAVDIVGIKPDDARRRRILHLLVCAVFVAVVLAFDLFNNSSVLDTIYTIVGYAYGPLLGLFAFGLMTKRMPRARFVPMIAVGSPLLCYGINYATRTLWDYVFGYELLMLNGLITFAALWLASIGRRNN